ncbi:synaptotagmin-1-like isoform X2 [Watersipora subatra]|uniref:synaptotagmin-1-like isoform X2 n=1 Tax=Watersipora subatra TaxID=2589382 RepID=UPI00355AE61B
MLPEPVYIVVIAVSVVLFVIIVGIVVLMIIRKRYSLNWYQKTLLKDSERCPNNMSGSLHVIRQRVASHNNRDQSSSSDEDSVHDDKSALLKEENSHNNLLDNLQKKVGFIQPAASELQKGPSSIMGGDQSKRTAFKPILKHHKSEGLIVAPDRRLSAPVIHGKSNAEVMGHAKLSATRSAPYGSTVADIDEQSFTLPLAVGDSASPAAQARHARRRSSMQDSIDATNLNPEFYKALDRAPTIKEEISIDIAEPIGVLFMSTYLNTDTGLLKVTLHKADFAGFPNAEIQLKMPYFTVFVTESHSATRHTKHSENAQHPIIEETFLFEVGEKLLEKKLVCELHDFDPFVKTEQVGVVHVRLNTIPEDEMFSLQKPIEMCCSERHVHDKDYVGELLFSINSNKTRDCVTIVVAKAKDLHIEDEISVLGLMVKATITHLGQRMKKKKTDHVKLSINPSFNQALTVQLGPAHKLEDINFILDVCKVRLSSTEVIGRVIISPNGEQKEVEHWKEVQESPALTTSLEWWHQLRSVGKKSTDSRT